MSMTKSKISSVVESFLGCDFLPWERIYLDKHWRRFRDTACLLPKPDDGARLLDVGIFPGQFAALAKEAGYCVDGLGNEEMTGRFLEHARAAEMRTNNIDIECDAFPAGDDTYDVVVCSEIIEHLYRSPFHMLSESFRVLKPGGSLIVTTPNLACYRNIFGLMSGKSYRHSIDKPLDETFPLNLNYGHYREYTMRELAYMLEHQDKEMYQFAVARRLYSRCWDEDTFLLFVKRITHPLWALLTLRNALFACLLPVSRSCLMIQATKPKHCAWIPIPMLTDVTGFGPVTNDAAEPGLSRRKLPTPFRSVARSAEFKINLPNKDRVALILQCANLAAESAGHIDAEFFINGGSVLRRQFPPTKGYVSVSLPIPRCDDASPLNVSIKTASSDDTHLLLSWSRMLVVA